MDLKKSPNELEDLKFVLATIGKIKDISLDVEMKIGDIQEAYRTLDMYKIEVPQDEMILQRSIRDQWEELQMEGKRIDARLVSERLPWLLSQVLLFVAKLKILCMYLLSLIRSVIPVKWMASETSFFFQKLNCFTLDALALSTKWVSSWKLQLLWEKIIRTYQVLDLQSFFKTHFHFFRLVPTKRKFTQITQQDIEKFGQKLADFQQRFQLEGPGAVGNDLDKGSISILLNISEGVTKYVCSMWCIISSEQFRQ